jgi:hypothetical protein
MRSRCSAFRCGSDIASAAKSFTTSSVSRPSAAFSRADRKAPAVVGHADLVVLDRIGDGDGRMLQPAASQSARAARAR